MPKSNKNRNLNKQILAIALPAIVTNITTPLLGLVDVAITGHLGAEYIAAIAIGGNMFNMLYWIFSFLRSGTSGITAQAFGQDDMRQSWVTLYRSVLVALAIAAVILLIHRPLLAVFLDWMEVTGATRTHAATYVNILIWGAPAFLMTYAITGWLIGMQSSASAMWMSLFINVANIATSLTLVYGFNLTIAGVAAGTLTAQWSGMLFGLTIVLTRFKPVKVTFRYMMDHAQLKRLFSVNRDLFIRTVCLVGVTVWFTRVGASEGTIVLAANTLLMQFFLFFSYFTDGFAYAGEALCGRYLGASDHGMLRLTIKRLLLWGGALSLVFAAVYGLGGTSILELLSDDKTVTDCASGFLPWIIILPITGFGAFIYDGVFIGITDTRHLLMSMVVSAAVFLAAYFILYPLLGNHGLWIAFLLYLLARSVYLHMTS